MGRAALAAAVIGALAGAALPACDLVFTPGKGPNATSDGPIGDDGAPGRDGVTPIADASIDAPQPPPDAVVDAGTCSVTCFTVDPGPGGPSPPGVAGCEFADDDVCPLHPELIPIDMCTCSAGEPEIYVEDFGATALIAFVGPNPSMSWSMIANGIGTCQSGDPNCTHDGPCFPGTPLWVWSAVPIIAGTTNRFEIYDDNGAGCRNGAVYTFTTFL